MRSILESMWMHWGKRRKNIPQQQCYRRIKIKYSILNFFLDATPFALSSNLNNPKTVVVVVTKIPTQFMKFPVHLLESVRGARNAGLAFFDETNPERHAKLIPTTTFN